MGCLGLPSFIGCANSNIQRSGETIKDATVKTGVAAKDFGRGVTEETAAILEEIKDGANVVAFEIKEGGILVSKKGEVLIDKTKKEFSEAAITAKIKAKFVKSPKVSALRIGVTTVEDRAILTGKAHCKDEVVEAIKLALSVEGVENVTSLLEIQK